MLGDQLMQIGFEGCSKTFVEVRFESDRDDMTNGIDVGGSAGLMSAFSRMGKPRSVPCGRESRKPPPKRGLSLSLSQRRVREGS